MQLNISTCYAMQIMLYLARNQRTIPSTELSANLRISQRYVLRISGKLRDGGYIAAHAGMSGGYSLGREPSGFNAYDIITLMEGDMSIPECVETSAGCGEPCKDMNLYSTLDIMKEYLDAYLKTITFDKLADMDISGKLSEILDLARVHIESMRYKG